MTLEQTEATPQRVENSEESAGEPTVADGPPTRVLVVARPRRMLARAVALMMTALVALLLALLIGVFAWEVSHGIGDAARDIYVEAIATWTLLELVAMFPVTRLLAERPLNSSWRLAPGEYQDPIGPSLSIDKPTRSAWWRLQRLASWDRPNWKRAAAFASVIAMSVAILTISDLGVIDITVVYILAFVVGVWSVLALIGGITAAWQAHKTWRGLIAKPEALNGPNRASDDRTRDRPWWKPRYSSAWPTRRTWPGPSYSYDVLIENRAGYAELAERMARRQERLAAGGILTLSILGSVLADNIYRAIADMQLPAPDESVPISEILAAWPIILVLVGIGMWIGLTDSADYHHDLAFHYRIETDVAVRRRWAQNEHDRLETLQRTAGCLSADDADKLTEFKSELGL